MRLSVLLMLSLSGCAAAIRPENDQLTTRQLVDRLSSYEGQRVRVSGFLVRTRERHLLLEGATRADSLAFSDNGLTATHWCSYDDQAEPLEISVSANDASKVAAQVINRDPSWHLIGQWVTVSGHVGKAPSVLEQEARDYRDGGLSYPALLGRVKLLKAQQSFCIGHKPS